MTEVLGFPKAWPDPAEIVELYAREVQILENGENDGYSPTVVDYVEKDVFTQEPLLAASIYEYMAGSADPGIKLKALLRIPDLSLVNPATALKLQAKLMADRELIDFISGQT